MDEVNSIIQPNTLMAIPGDTPHQGTSKDRLFLFFVFKPAHVVDDFPTDHTITIVHLAHYIYGSDSPQFAHVVHAFLFHPSIELNYKSRFSPTTQAHETLLKMITKFPKLEPDQDSVTEQLPAIEPAKGSGPGRKRKNR